MLKSRFQNKIPRINLTKEVKGLYLENCEALMKENRWKDIPCSWMKELILLK